MGCAGGSTVALNRARIPGRVSWEAYVFATFLTCILYKNDAISYGTLKTVPGEFPPTLLFLSFKEAKKWKPAGSKTKKKDPGRRTSSGGPAT